jgi:hypothetical protein
VEHSLSGGRLIKHKVLTCKRDPPPSSKVLDLSLRKFSLTEIWFWFNFFIRRKQTQYGIRGCLEGTWLELADLTQEISQLPLRGSAPMDVPVSKPVGANGSTHELIE